MTEVGQVPIVVRRELDGFILNRLQGALLSEAMRLVGEGYVSPEDLDKTVRDGLGLRWSFMGPFATIELNAPGGVADYCARYGGFYRRLAADPRRAGGVGCSERGERRRGARRRRARPRSAKRGRMARPPPDGAGRAQDASKPNSNEGGNAWQQAPQSHHHLRRHRLDPHAVDVAASADHAAGDRRRRGRRGGSRARRSSTCTRAIRSTDIRRRIRNTSASSRADIARRSDVVINFTTGGAATMTIEERLQPALQLKPEVASLNMGSMNFGLYPDAQALQGRSSSTGSAPISRASDDRIFKNTFKDIEYILTSCADNGTRFEIECYDIGHLYTAAHFFDRGIVKPPLFIQSVFGILGGIGAHPDDVAHMKRTADRLFGDQYRWSVLGAGRNQLPIAAMSAAMGGNVRVGLEDSLWLGPGKLAESNAAQVRAARAIIEALGLAVATPDEAREILKLKGRAAVAF